MASTSRWSVTSATAACCRKPVPSPHPRPDPQRHHARDRAVVEDEPRWLLRPRNLGRATVEGGSSTPFRLTELRAGRLPLDLRMNLSPYRSRVEIGAGPDNASTSSRIATATSAPTTASAGTQAWTVGGTLGITPGYRTQRSPNSRARARPAPRARRLRAVADRRRRGCTCRSANLAPIDSDSAASVVQGSLLQTVNTVGRTDLNATLRLEMRALDTVTALQRSPPPPSWIDATARAGSGRWRWCARCSRTSAAGSPPARHLRARGRARCRPRASRGAG